MSEGNALCNSGSALETLGEREEAVRRLREARAIFESIGARHQSEEARRQLAEWGAAGEPR